MPYQVIVHMMSTIPEPPASIAGGMLPDGCAAVRAPRHNPFDFLRIADALFPLFPADKKHFIFNTWNLILVLACLATAALASYSAIELIISGFQTGSSATSFSCHSPLDDS